MSGASRTAADVGVEDGAHALVEALEQLEIGVAFGLPGVHNLPLWQALAASPVRLVGVRHEQTAVYAADGLARTTGELGVALTTTGPGAANALGATGEAWASGSPLLVIATDIPLRLRRPGICRGVLHESRDQAGMFEPVVRRTFRVEDPGAIATTALAAARLALTPPTGPVYLEIPTDLLAAPAPAAPPPTTREAPAEPDWADSATQAAALLSAARRPLIWAGGGALRAGAGAALGALAERLGAPVIETYMARGLLALDHPWAVGLPPHVPGVGRLWDDADVVLAVGTDFDGMMTQNWAMPAPPSLIAVNVDATDATKNYEADVLLAGDARRACEALLERLPERRAGAMTAAGLERLRLEAHAQLEQDEPQATTLLESLRLGLPSGSAVFCDMCIPGYWIAGFHRFDRPRRLAYPVGWGTLGFAFPASIGASLASEDPVLCVCGDGGFLFACGELATLRQERAPLTVLLVDDGGYGMLRFDQDHAGHARAGVDLDSPDFLGLARSFGVAAEPVDGLGAPLRDALERHMATDEPSLIVVQASMKPPPTTSPRWYRHSIEGAESR